MYGFYVCLYVVFEVDFSKITIATTISSNVIGR